MAFSRIAIKDMLNPFCTSNASTSFARVNSTHSTIPPPAAPSLQAVSRMPSKSNSAPKVAFLITPSPVQTGDVSLRLEEAPFTVTKPCAGLFGWFVSWG